MITLKDGHSGNYWSFTDVIPTNDIALIFHLGQNVNRMFGPISRFKDVLVSGKQQGPVIHGRAPARRWDESSRAGPTADDDDEEKHGRDAKVSALKVIYCFLITRLHLDFSCLWLNASSNTFALYTNPCMYSLVHIHAVLAKCSLQKKG